MSKGKSKSKTNPRRQPVTQADIGRAKKLVRDEALRYISVLSLTVLRDKFGYGPVRLDRYWKAVNELADSVAQGYVSMNDLEKVLLDEGGIRVR